MEGTGLSSLAVRSVIRRWAMAWLLLAPFVFWQASHAQNNPRPSHNPQADPKPRAIKIVMDDNYPPYIFRGNDGKLQGILKDTWELWSKKTGIPVDIHAMDWGAAQQIMYAGNADVIDTAFRTAEREKLLQFSSPYATLETVIFFHKTIGGIQSVSDLRGFTVGVKEGGATTAWLGVQGVSNLRKYPSYEAIVQAALKDEVRVFCMEKAPALYFLYKSGHESEFRHSATLYSGQFHWATLKGNVAMHRTVEQGFAKISRAEREAIEERWKGASLQSRIELRYAKYIAATLLLVLGVAAFLVLLNWTLRRKVVAKTAELSTTLEALRTSEQYNRMLFESTTVGLRLCKLDGTIVDANQSFADIIGYTVPETLQLSLAMITAPEYTIQDQHHLKILLTEGEYGPYEKEYIKKDGTRVTVSVTGALVERGGQQFILSSVEDVTDQKATKERINFLAFHDSLTSLPNRMYAQERFTQAAAHADQERTKVALMLFDLDNFKSINDSLGHVTGDVLLKAVARRLKHIFDDSVTISRQGGDEFLIVYPGLPSADAVAQILANLMIQMQEIFEIEGNELATSISAGVAVYPEDGRDFDTLMRNADIAMYHAKDAGRNAFCFFDQEMHTKAFERLNLGSRLRRALDRNELQLHYQPLVDLGSNKVIGAEALLRWEHPDLGMVSPGRFIALAEDTGLIVPIGDWVLQEACRQAAVWQRNGARDFRMAINLSAAQFRRHDFERSVRNALESSQIDPALIELELTESILLTNAENALDTVRRLKSFGIKLSIDDFGTGYSSLSYLKRLAVDKLKIDRSFIRNVTADADDAAIVRAIIQMAKSLGLKTLAEGVEEKNVLDWLQRHQCDEAQGYYFAKPMPAEQFEDYLKSTSEK